MPRRQPVSPGTVLGDRDTEVPIFPAYVTTTVLRLNASDLLPTDTVTAIAESDNYG